MAVFVHHNNARFPVEYYFQLVIDALYRLCICAKSKLKILIKFLAGISETKVFCEVITTTREIKVINEFPDVSEEDINIGFYSNDLFINAEDQKRSYYEVVHLPNGVSGKGLK